MNNPITDREALARHVEAFFAELARRMTAQHLAHAADCAAQDGQIAATLIRTFQEPANA